MDPVRMQRIEGLFFFLAALWAYSTLDVSWWLFVIFLLAPDISIIGYCFNATVGASVYNFVHMYALPGIAAAIGYEFNLQLLLALAIIWFAHIGMDRAFGYGLKLPTGFRDTHLGPIGRFLAS